MSVERSPGAGRSGFEIVKDFVLTAAHLGRLHPGMRVPSVRRMAQLTSLDRKIVHRAYSRLIEEGLLTARRSSGTYLAEAAPGPEPMTHVPDLVEIVERCMEDVKARGLEADVVMRVLALIATDGLRGFPVAVAECNDEQIGLIARECAQTFGVVPVELNIRHPRAQIEAGLSRARAVIATNCHRDEVLAMAVPCGLPVSFAALDRHYADPFIARAHRGEVLLVVRDLQFERGFRRMLGELKVEPEVLQRFHVADLRGAESAMRAMPPGSSVYVSPLVDERQVAIPRVHRRLVPENYVEHASLRRIRVELAHAAIRCGWLPGETATRSIRRLAVPPTINDSCG